MKSSLLRTSYDPIIINKLIKIKSIKSRILWKMSNWKQTLKMLMDVFKKNINFFLFAQEDFN